MRLLLEEVLPQGTRRRRWYELGSAAWRTLRDEGWKSFWWKCRAYLRDLRAARRERRKERPKKPRRELDWESLARWKLRHFLAHPKGRLSFPRHDEPVVSIIVLTFNKAHLTYQCLESILAHADLPYELVIVDNNSLDETPALLERCENAVIIRNEQNLGFVRGCNQGAKVARGSYLLFLNNDTVVTANWLSSLVATIEGHPRCGAVGCKLVWPNGRLQEAGSVVWADGSTSGYGRGDDPLSPPYCYLREVDYCSGACLLVRRDLFWKLGGFDERYAPAYYEDADLCLGIARLGYRVLFQPAVVVFHHEFGSSSWEAAKSLMEANRQRFREKWKGLLQQRLPPAPQHLLRSRDLRKGTPLLFLDDRIPLPQHGSGFPRAYSMVKFLAELGYKVTLFPLDDATPWQPTTDELQQFGVEVFYGRDLNLLRFCKERRGYYEVVLISRPHNARKSLYLIKRFFPAASIIYDAEALFAVREELKAGARGYPLPKDRLRRMLQKEIDLMREADLVIAVSPREAEMIKKMGKIEEVRVWGHALQVRKPSTGFHERSGVLFVGSFLGFDSPNEDAVLYFVKEIWPRVEGVLQCPLFVVGMAPPDSVKKLAGPLVRVTGYVENLEQYYESCRVFIVPHRFAAGISWKLHEAMGHGLPAVVSELIAAQLNLVDGGEVLVAHDEEEFAQKVVNLYRNEELWYTLQRNALEYVERTCNPSRMKALLDELVRCSLQRRRPAGDCQGHALRKPGDG